MATLEKMTAPGNVREIPGWEDLSLLQAMMAKNDFTGLPMHAFVENGKVIAAAIVDPDAYPLYAKVWCLEVSPNYRGKGYGRLVMEDVLNEYDDVKLVAMRDAFGFYKKMGFVFVEEPDPKSNVGYMLSKA